jgi:hypothetical protein
VIFEVLAEVLERDWWQALNAALEARFRQDRTLVRAQSVEVLRARRPPVWRRDRHAGRGESRYARGPCPGRPGFIRPEASMHRAAVAFPPFSTVSGGTP